MQTLTMVLGDTQSDIEKKTKYYTNLKDTFNFEEEMKDFLSEKSTRLLESCIKLQNMTYATQRKLQDNYPNGQKLEIGSVYRCHNLIGFYYYLLIAYSTKNLELPIYALKNSENGVYTSGCSKKEYVFQNWVKYERKNHVIFASHIHKNGGKKFGRLYPDLYDSSALEIIAYNGCFFHGHLGTVSTPINSTLKEWPSSEITSFCNYTTLTDLDSSCPGSLLKTTPPPPGYPWVSGGRYVTPEPRFRGLVLDHQGLEELELKNHPKTAVFDQIWLFLSGFLVLVLLKADGRAPNP